MAYVLDGANVIAGFEEVRGEAVRQRTRWPLRGSMSPRALAACERMRALLPLGAVRKAKPGFWPAARTASAGRRQVRGERGGLSN